MESANRNKRHIRHLGIHASAYGDFPSRGARGDMLSTIMANSALRTFDLERNSVGDNGALALSEALKTNSTPTTLNLMRNWIGDNGAQGLSEALKMTNSTLTTLNLRHNLMEDHGAQALSEVLKTNSTLTSKIGAFRGTQDEFDSDHLKHGEEHH